jgi:amino acid transporter
MLALYSYAFGAYLSALIAHKDVSFIKDIAIVGVITLFTIINFLGAFVSGKTEDFMVIVKVSILLLFSLLGLFTADFTKLSPEHWENLFKILTGGLIIFLAYEGFELIANTAQDIENPKILPKAFFASVLTVIFIYVLVAIVAVGNLSLNEIQKYQDYALAVAAQPFLGKLGFILISIAALLSTASAINATLYGSARISYLIAKFGSLPKDFTKKIWKNGTEGLLIIALITILFAIAFNIENIATAGSLGFLIIFGFVNLANFKLYKETNSNRWISFIGFIACLISIVVLVTYSIKHNPNSLKSALILFLGTLLFELAYRIIKKREIKEFVDWKLKEIEEFLKNKDKELEKLKVKIKEIVEDAIIEINDLFEKEKVPRIEINIKTQKPINKEELIEKLGLKEREHLPVKLTINSS